MSIIYSLISKIKSSDDMVNLVSYDMAYGNYPTVTQ